MPVQWNTCCEKEDFSLRFTQFRKDTGCLQKMVFIVLVRKQARVVETAGKKKFKTMQHIYHK